MEIAVTGASGFIGRHLVDALRYHGHTVITLGRHYYSIPCDRVYHLACPSSTAQIKADPKGIMDIIIDKTREALTICPTATFVYASSMGVKDLANNAQGAYNIAKRCMEVYLEHSGINYVSYRLPSVYGPDMNKDGFIKRCVEGTAYYPPEPYTLHYIAHIDDVVNALVNLSDIPIEEITLGNIYESFNSGRRGLSRATPY